MTLNSPPQSASGDRKWISSRRVSTLATLPEDLSASDEKLSGLRKRVRPSSQILTRQVSNEGLSCLSEKENAASLKRSSSHGRDSPTGCHCEFKAASKGAMAKADTGADDTEMGDHESIPPLPNPLHNAGLLSRHVGGLRLEAELHPLRLILSRLMGHPTFNRKGIFNCPVDPVALGLPDYFKIISKPMDLGSVKVRLHAVAYHSRREVVDDIRLVFSNAMKYNPPNNAVHISASQMLAFFEDQVRSFVPELANTSLPAGSAPVSQPSQTVTASVAAAPANASVVPTVTTESVPAALPPVSGASVGNTAGAARPTLGTRLHAPPELLDSSAMMQARKRKKRGSRVNHDHNCQWCEGRVCTLCEQGCLALEPTLLICNGAQCAGTRIRKGAVYFIAPDGSRQFCQRCFSGLPALLPSTGQDDTCRYKRELLKRKNDEEVVERWLTCVHCKSGVHQVCAMHNEFVHPTDEYACPDCVATGEPAETPKAAPTVDPVDVEGTYTFVTGSELPLKMSEVSRGDFRFGEHVLSADALQETEVSRFIQSKVRKCMVSDETPYAESTILVRVISDCDRFLKVPEVVRKHFQMASGGDESTCGVISPPSTVNYRSKAIALFQKIDGLDVCVFCMYVQEYDGDDEYESEDEKNAVVKNKRVYIAYLDSVEHFRPRRFRTNVYHELLVAYLATARKRGYETAHIWACPPSRGNSFVFWNHPASQRTPTKERLVAWYHAALSRALDCGVVTDVKSLYESSFQRFMDETDGSSSSNAGESVPGYMLCPPLLDGDFWIEEAVRVHSLNMTRNLKANLPAPSQLGAAASGQECAEDRCPATQIAAVLRDRVMAHSSCEPFRRPVNAAALKLKDYHTIISKPMDLGTVYSHCVLGEYLTLGDLVADVDLVFSNAKRYNPPGHLVHNMAIEMSKIFYDELDLLVMQWQEPPSNLDSWTRFAGVSLNLDATISTKVATSCDVSVDSESVNTGSVAVVSLAGADENGHCDSSTASDCKHHSGAVQSSKDCSDEASSPLEDKILMSPEPLLGGGVEAVQQRMVGSDTWLLDKRNPAPPKTTGATKKSGSKRRKSLIDSTEEPVHKRRRQSWLGEEVGSAVRRMRTSFFTCSLSPKTSMSREEEEKVKEFEHYGAEFESLQGSVSLASPIADARHAFLEFSQFRNLEFDTLRRAKYSTAMLLYHLHNNDAPGMAPVCSNCHQGIEDVRWHKLNRVIERRRPGRHPPVGRKAAPKIATSFQPAELCSSCHSSQVSASDEQFIPLQVSFKS